jgi:hypothetical protein
VEATLDGDVDDAPKNRQHHIDVARDAAEGDEEEMQESDDGVEGALLETSAD